MTDQRLDTDTTDTSDTPATDSAADSAADSGEGERPPAPGAESGEASTDESGDEASGAPAAETAAPQGDEVAESPGVETPGPVAADAAPEAETVAPQGEQTAEAAAPDAEPAEAVSEERGPDAPVEGDEESEEDHLVKAARSPEAEVADVPAEEETPGEGPDRGDPRAVISEAQDPEAAARAALGLGDEEEDADEIAPEAAAAILKARAEPEVEAEEETHAEVVETDEALSDADLVEVYEEEPAEPSPYDRPGDWYVVHTYSGYEKKVKSNLESRVKSLNLEGRIHEVVIPMDDVIEFKGGKKTVVQKKVFPGYLLCRMHLDDSTWGAVRNTPGVTGFVGGGAKPTPLSRKEVESILRVTPEDEAKKARPRLEFEVGDQVRVTAGPFADFNGLIDEINVDQSTLKVLVNIFGRETPVTLDFADVAKL